MVSFLSLQKRLAIVETPSYRTISCVPKSISLASASSCSSSGFMALVLVSTKVGRSVLEYRKNSRRLSRFANRVRSVTNNVVGHFRASKEEWFKVMMWNDDEECQLYFGNIFRESVLVVRIPAFLQRGLIIFFRHFHITSPTIARDRWGRAATKKTPAAKSARVPMSAAVASRAASATTATRNNMADPGARSTWGTTGDAAVSARRRDANWQVLLLRDFSHQAWG
jgi:hypothetical protein